MISQIVSLPLRSLGEAEASSKKLERNATLRALIDRLSSPVSLPETLATLETELLDLVDAGGAVIRLSGAAPLYFGRTPPRHTTQGALAKLQQSANGDIVAVDDFGRRHPELASCISDGTGVLLAPLAKDSDDAIVWFRPECLQTVTWGGKPAEHASWNPSVARISPRASFAAWKETKRGRSSPWSKADLEHAHEFRDAIVEEIAHRTKDELVRLRYYDPLTGLPNRRLLQDRLAALESKAGTTTALLFIDLDRFKTVNDMMGHAAGDALLVEISQRLLATAGPENLVGRIGGDEFVVLCSGQDSKAPAELSERIRQAIEVPFDISGRWCNVSASIGVAIANQLSGLDLVRAADIAMYAAKQGGGNRAMVFERSLYDHASLQFELDQDLRKAVGGDQFTLLYQPLFKLAGQTNRLFGFEALLRWHHPRHGWLVPDLFIPMAEKTGLINPLGDWVLETAMRQGQIFRAACPSLELKLNVNVSPKQLAQPNFCSRLGDLLLAEGFPPDTLCLEVTEKEFGDVAAAYVLANVRKLGVRVAIDDFGTGYSSLSYLRHLPVDVVKLDRSFLDASNDGRGEPVLRAIVALAHAMGMSVVQEGVETEAQLEMISAAGADLAQGFLFSVPLSAEDAIKLALRL